MKDAGEPDAEADVMEAYGKEPSMITSDPPDHDRRAAMRCGTSALLIRRT